MSQDEVKKIKLKVKCRAIDESELSFDKQDKFLESGTYGKVRRALFEGKQVAVKYFLSAEQKRGYNQELVFLSTLQKHDHIVCLHGTGKAQKQPFIVMEFAPYSLERVLHGPVPRYCYNAGHVLHWSRQIAVGLEYIHNKRILHRDIKASNLLLFGNGSHLKLCDFGTCRNLETNLLYTANIGTVRYMAPEVIKGEPYTQKCDIFSFAITLWEMLARKVPTVSASEHCNTYAILFQMAEGKRPPEIVNLPPAISELINKCWHQDPNLRLSSISLVKKLISLSSYFECGVPITIETIEDIAVLDENFNDDTVKPSSEEDKDDIIIPSLISPEQPSSPIVRTQSDITHVKSYLDELEMKRINLSHVTHNEHEVQGFSGFQPQTSLPPVVESKQLLAQELSHGYPPRESYPSPKRTANKDNLDLVLRRNSSGSSEVHVDHEVQEVNDPDSDDKRYVSMDENVLRFDVQQQYRKLEQAYQSTQGSTSLPSSINSRVKSRNSLTSIKPNRATGDSPYAIPGLPPEMQPVIPVENDPESLRIYQQYKKLSSHYQPP